MKAKPQSTQLEIEASPIRLTADETRTILRAHVAPGPVSFPSYQCSVACGLEDLGIFQRVAPDATITKQLTAACWKKVRAAVPTQDRVAIRQAFEDLDKAISTSEKASFCLTDLGKQVARGVPVKMASRAR